MKNLVIFFIFIFLTGCVTTPSSNTYVHKYNEESKTNNNSMSFSVDTKSGSTSDWQIHASKIPEIIQNKFDNSHMFKDVTEVVSVKYPDNLFIKFDVELRPSSSETAASVFSGLTLTLIPVVLTHELIIKVIAQKSEQYKTYKYKDTATQIVWFPLFFISPFLTTSSAAEELISRTMDKLIDDMANDGFL